MYVWKVDKPCEKRKRDVIHRKEAVTTWREHLELHHQEHAMKVCLVGGAIKVCLLDSFIPPYATLQDSLKHGFPGGCYDCRARGIVNNNDGGQICFHSTESKAITERQDDITDADLQDLPDLIDVM
jgi:hypothetical protein